MDKEPSDFYDWLNKLSLNNIHYFLEGGQAVNLWAYRFVDENTTLKNYLPFTSKDCDIWIDADAFKNISKVLDGSFVRSSSPSDGQLGIITSEDQELTLDLLSNVFGLNMDELRQTEKRVLEIENIKIIDPIYLFKGKCHNLVNLPQIDRHDGKHTLMLSLIIPEYIKGYIDALDTGTPQYPRELINEIKLLLSLQKDQFVREAMNTLDLTIEQLIPLDELSSCSNELIRKYTEGSLKRLFTK